MEKHIIIMTSPDGHDRTFIGTFEDEELADDYCRLVLQPKFGGSSFYITTIISPLQFKELIPLGIPA